MEIPLGTLSGIVVQLGLGDEAFDDTCFVAKKHQKVLWAGSGVAWLPA